MKITRDDKRFDGLLNTACEEMQKIGCEFEIRGQSATIEDFKSEVEAIIVDRDTNEISLKIKHHVIKESFIDTDEDEGVYITGEDWQLPWDDESVNRVSRMYGSDYDIEAVCDFLADTAVMSNTQIAVRGDGLAYHFILTKKEQNND